MTKTAVYDNTNDPPHHFNDTIKKIQHDSNDTGKTDDNCDDTVKKIMQKIIIIIIIAIMALSRSQ